MTTERDDNGGRSGLMGALRLLAVLAVLLLGGLAVLMVLDVIPRDTFSEIASKAIASIAIFAAVSGAVALLVRSK